MSVAHITIRHLVNVPGLGDAWHPADVKVLYLAIPIPTDCGILEIKINSLVATLRRVSFALYLRSTIEIILLFWVCSSSL